MLGAKHGSGGRSTGRLVGRAGATRSTPTPRPHVGPALFEALRGRAPDRAPSPTARSWALRVAAAVARTVTGADRAAATLSASLVGAHSLLVEQDGPAPPLPLVVIRTTANLVRSRSVPVTRVAERPGLWPAGAPAVGALAAVPLRLDPFGGCLMVTSASRRPFSGREVSGLLAAARCAELTLGTLQAAASIERDRIARILHDTFGQTLTGLVFTLDELDGVRSRAAEAPVRRRVRSCALQAVRQMRALVNSGLAEGKPKRGPVPQITDLLKHISRVGIAVEFRCAPGLDRIPGEVVACLHHVAREALLNVRRHAAARRVQVHIVRRDRDIELVVADDGCGLHGLRQRRWGGVGLRMMRERVENLGGTFIVQSPPGEGTRVEVRIPGTADPWLAGPGRHRG